MAKNKSNPIVILDEQQGDGRHKFNEVKIDLPENDADIVLKFPSGRTMVVRWENIDSCMRIVLPAVCPVGCWIGPDVRQSFTSSGYQQMECEQIEIDLPISAVCSRDT